MSDAVSTIGASTVSTIGILAVTGMAINAIDKTSRRVSGGRSRSSSRKSSKSYNVWKGTKKHGKKNSMLGF